MFRLTRPLLQAARKTTTGVTGLHVHSNPLPELVHTYQSTLSLLSTIPESSVYRQGVEALTQRKLDIVNAADGNIAAVEKELEDGQIEQALDIAKDELSLLSKMIEWKPWEPLEEKPEKGQWEYFGSDTLGVDPIQHS
ncbi:NADH2 dehydrogenase [Punctularia strigosozonata HHB-11173 SS5]|uniref:NADH2 dehydrogenase n=1 Tax=Punctularia strigosozonata (strain HHB-11173) TaxID=741275 RepID=UPI0004416A48|nr:NADH2 dehydrogenase [Punctularia strigosozonata HHB-11173 SS5]EIN13704.1 NADH2 dehydrogenase [Punctularia strigosozonata HHB-11173 SS5]